MGGLQQCGLHRQQFATATDAGAIRHPITGLPAVAGVHSGARVLTSAQAGVGVHAANFRGGSSDIYTVSKTSKIGRQTFQSTDREQAQVSDSS